MAAIEAGDEAREEDGETSTGTILFALVAAGSALDVARFFFVVVVDPFLMNPPPLN